MTEPAHIPVVSVRDLTINFGTFCAVDGLSFDLMPEETLGLVGESGSGKSMTALAILGLLPAQAKVSGQILIDGQNLLTMSERSLSALRGNSISMIFQEPSMALNPVMPVGRQVAEVMIRHEKLSAAAARSRAVELFDLVGLKDPHRLFDEYPHRLSGGMQQRVMISIAIACRPRVLIADEPTTALDVTVQAQVLELIDQLRRQLSMSVLLITHDIGVVADWTDRTVVMQHGHKREENPTAALLASPQHPYTQQLLNASLPLGSDAHFRNSRLPEMNEGPAPLSREDDDATSFS